MMQTGVLALATLIAFIAGGLVSAIIILIFFSKDEPDEFEGHGNIYDGCDWPSKKDDDNG